MADDSTPDLYIKLSGLQTLTAADFALTAAQSSALYGAGGAAAVAPTISGTEGGPGDDVGGAGQALRRRDVADPNAGATET